ncbi:uncharacterized protein FOMMEDRAFT_146742 [Fomitiporia mediterranea MF3/22]|uniref:uncharacterized protein n=1 Tax=Fomitiporia mediterranea (strain MF3/22) TaxID=694068 RepID=UPI0004408ACD|nr:uncharacterized protein FOMMEDRAFT_146742 [Fomitiporia mediterranea MF3/22]EJD03014.1 hypothetical protein FOMMEDRAFT_146742 [Fomitiporia mediterranea MF3/22]
MSQPKLRRKSKNTLEIEKHSEQHPVVRPASTRLNLHLRGIIFVKLLVGSVLLAAFAKIFNIKPSSVELFPSSYALCCSGTGRIYTVDENNSNVQCMVIHDSRILLTGSLDDVNGIWNAKQHSSSTEGSQNVFNTPLNIKFLPPEAIVVPGMSDSHGHILEYGASRLLLLEGSKDSTEVVGRVRNYILSHTDILNDSSRFIEGWGWDHTAWPIEKFPSYEELEADSIVRGRPIILQSKDGHAQWISKVLLEQMLPLPSGIDGGIIVQDRKGNPTGVFLDKAQDLVKKPPYTDADRMLRFNHTVKDALSRGLTSLHDAGFDPASLDFFKRLARLEKLSVRIYGMSYFDENANYWGGKAEKIIDQNRLTARSVKMFADGALRSGGAALFDPYTDNPDTSGFMRIDTDKLYKFIPKFLGDGWQVNIHAIGDRANSIVLDVIESAIKEIGENSLRPRIEHAQIIRPQDAARIAKLGVIASVQPTHAVSDMWYAHERLGSERVKNLYAFRTIIDAGARITLGSDFPVEDMNPLAGFQAAVTRLSPDGHSPHGPGGWFPEQCLTRIEALRGFTIDPAYASFSEKDLGSLEPGKIADYVVLSQDIMTIPVSKILLTKVLATVIDGRPEYGSI